MVPCLIGVYLFALKHILADSVQRQWLDLLEDSVEPNTWSIISVSCSWISLKSLGDPIKMMFRSLKAYQRSSGLAFSPTSPLRN